jgi:UPF0176 protein
MLNKPYSIIGFYKFIPLDNLLSLKHKLLDFCNKHSIKGTIIIATEGVNSTLSCTNEQVENLCFFLKNTMQFGELDFKISYANFIPFKKMKVRIKKQTLTFPGISVFNPEQLEPSSYVDAEKWNSIIQQPDTVILDTRNHYEYVMGSFDKAINPGINKFSEFQEWAKTKLQNNTENSNAAKAEKTLAIFCTGGKRCEKAYFFLQNLGFSRVVQLDGGIQRYLEACRDNPKLQNFWQGNLFVFDDRVAIDKQLNPLYEG